DATSIPCSNASTLLRSALVFSLPWECAYGRSVACPSWGTTIRPLLHATAKAVCCIRSTCSDRSSLERRHEGVGSGIKGVRAIRHFDCCSTTDSASNGKANHAQADGNCGRHRVGVGNSVHVAQTHDPSDLG